jgi:hypothetical protein
LEDLSSGVLYTTGMPGAEGDSAKITRSPENISNLIKHQSSKMGEKKPKTN